MILATTIFIIAGIALDRVPDAFAFFCVTSSRTSLLSGTFGSSGWIGFLRTVCSEFQLLSPKCKVLSQKSCSWITSVKLGGSRRPLSTSGIGTFTFSPSSADLNRLLLCSNILSACKFFLFSAISRISTIFDFLKQRPQSSPSIFDKSFHCTLAS